jgi:hypothetical protein
LYSLAARRFVVGVELPEQYREAPDILSRREALLDLFFQAAVKYVDGDAGGMDEERALSKLDRRRHVSAQYRQRICWY